MRYAVTGATVPDGSYQVILALAPFMAVTAVGGCDGTPAAYISVFVENGPQPYIFSA